MITLFSILANDVGYFVKNRSPFRTVIGIITLTTLILARPIMSAEIYVFHASVGTIEPNSPSVIATRHEIETKAVLKSSLELFFDGPSEEVIAGGAFKAFKCSNDGENLFDCGSQEIFKSVSIRDSIAFIELSGVPAAATSAQWQGFIIPFTWTVTQFPNVSDFRFIVHGVTFEFGGEGCSEMCFLILDSAEDVEEWIQNNF